MTAHVDEDVVGLRLSAQARPAGAEGRMTSVLATVVQQSDDVADGARRHDDLRNEAIRAGIRGVPDKVDSAVQNLVRADQLGQRLAQLPGRAGGQPAGNAIFGWVAWRVTDPSRIGLQQGHDGVVSSGGQRWTIGVVMRPIRSTSTSTTSPGRKNIGGIRVAPMPSGVPVAMRSPGLSVITPDAYAAIWAPEKMRFDVLPSWTVLPLTRVWIRS